MGLIGKIKNHVIPNILISEYSLYAVRFKKMLDHGRILHNLFADGQEKYSSEYIFDFHYIVTLIENVMGNLSKLVFHASVLVPEGSENLFMELDKIKEEAKKFICEANSQSKVNIPHSNSSTSLLQEPELILLKEVTGWFDDPLFERQTIQSFLSDVFHHVLGFSFMKSDEAGTVFFLRSNSFSGKIKAVPFFDITNEIHRPEKIINFCRPLNFMCRDVDIQKEGDHEKKVFSKFWTAVYDENYLSLSFTMGNEIAFRLESCVFGNQTGDFIFVYSASKVGLDEIISSCGDNFDLVSNRYNKYGWCCNIPVAEMEKILINIGDKIFKEDFLFHWDFAGNNPVTRQ